MNTRRHTSVAGRLLAALTSASLALLIAAAAHAVTAPAPAATTPTPPSITVTLAGSFVPGGAAQATVKATGGSKGPTYVYKWQVNGSATRTQGPSSSTSDSLSLSGLKYGDTVAVSVTPFAGSTAGKAAGASASLLDHTPTAKVTLKAASGFHPTGQATASVTTADSDGDCVTVSYVWSVDGKTVRTVNGSKATSDTYSWSKLAVGQVVTVAVVPNDGTMAGATATASGKIVAQPVQDQPPTVTISALVDPTASSATTSTSGGGSRLWSFRSSGGSSQSPSTTAPPWRPDGTATVSATGSDPDGDAVTFTYVWKVGNTVEQTTANTTATSDTFTWSDVRGGTAVTVTVTPNDGTKDGTPVTGSLTITETPPTATVQLYGDVRAGGLALARVTTSDADNDHVTLTYVWSLNGAVQQIDTGTTILFNLFALPRTLKDDAKLTLRVVPTDGYFNGTVAQGTQEAQSASDDGGGDTNSNYDPSADPYSMYDTTLFTGAQAWWDAGFTGQGVDVAVIDTGVSPVPALAASGKIVYGPDLSLDSQNPKLAGLDSNGHGTFMAGLIAGHDPALKAPYSKSPASAYAGMAPDSRILSVKVGATDGEVDVTQVIAAIDWIVQHRHDNGMNIRVISLSYGTNSTQSYLDDPLAYAAEQAWKAGIVVVAAAGNTGFQQGAGAPGVADPAMDPFVLAVGGYDTMGTYDSSDDSLGDYSASSAGCPAPACKGPDLLAAGSHLQGLRDPGSFIDLNHPEGRLGTSYFRGSGTSQATALTAGTVALVLQRYPAMTPDDVKAYLERGASELAGIPDTAQGAGAIDLFNLLDTPAVTDAAQSYPSSTGTGTIEGARGSDHLNANGVVLSGEEDIFGKPVDTTALASAEAAQTSWNGGVWNGISWSGNSWSGNSWSGASWTAAGWFGNSWSGNTWSGNSWSGNSWSGNSWSGNTWSGNTWSGNSWSGNSWSGNSWSGNSWSGNSWSSDTWS